MSFLILIVVASLLAWLPQAVFGDRRDWRQAIRHGLALGLLFTGIDHFVHDELRYLPMMPAAFGAAALPLVWFTGACELAGAIGLLVPAGLACRFGLPRLHRAAGIALALLFSVMVIANIHMAMQGTDVVGLPFGQLYLYLRPLLQPVFIVWALVAGGVILRGARDAGVTARSAGQNTGQGTQPAAAAAVNTGRR